jgi:hypothetical protein
MSDDQPRAEDGTFASADLPLGGETLAADLGYKPMATEAPEQVESDIMQEVQRLQQSRAPQDDPNAVVEIRYQNNETGEKLPENLTVSEQRAKNRFSRVPS